MKYDYDLIVIGLGPAGMAVSVMGSEMGLKVCAIEKHKVGGECMNVGCIPSKALLRMAKHRAAFDKLARMELAPVEKPAVQKPFERIAGSLKYISDKKTMKMFDKVDMIYQQGSAEFVDDHTVSVGEKRYTAQRIFIATGTSPAVPDFPGLGHIGYLTNENIFSQEKVPESLIVLGGGAIACEMAQAFARLGSKVTMIIRGPRLIWRHDLDATNTLEAVFEAEGITILREDKPAKFSRHEGLVVMETEKGDTVQAAEVLVAAGRKMDYSAMKLDNAGITTGDKGQIVVDKFLRTSQKHIYAVGDCNGYAMFSHAAMHQGMIALINSMTPWPMKQNYKKFVVPWTVFTEPQFSHVGSTQKQLVEQGVKYETIKVDYGDYGAAIAEAVDVGFIKAFVTPAGRILGVYVVGEGSGEIINEWALAVQKKLRIHNIMFLQHSFPTMGFLTKRTAETWMMNRMKSNFLKKMCTWMFRF